MASRSGYSRKLNAKKHSGPAPPPLPTVPAARAPVTSRRGSQDDFDVSYQSNRLGAQSAQGRPRSTSHASRSSHGMTSPSSSRPTLESRPTVVGGPLRQGYEEHCENFRNKIATKLTKKSEKGSTLEKQQQQFTSQEDIPRPPSQRDQVYSPYAASSRSSGTQPPGRSRMPRSNTSGFSTKSFDPLEGTGFQVRKFNGHGKKSQAWMNLKHDPELWHKRGDTMVYYGTNSQHAPLPEASFRLPSQTLTKSCGSQFFVDMLHLGHPQQSQELPPSPTSSPENVITPNYLSESRQSTYPERRDFAEETRSPRSSTRAPFNEHARGPTPPSDDNQERDSRVKPRNELFFPIPTTDSHEVILRNHLSIRNVFALIFKASLVGLDFYQALCDLLDRMNQYFPDQDNKQEIIEYLYKQGLEDVRNDPESAMGLMAWSEQSDVQWTDGFREGFVHCVGMYHEVKQLPNFNNVRFLTQQSLQQKSNELYLRIKEAENMLADFDFSEMWPMSSANPPMARVSFVRFQVSLKQLYENIYFQWPPKTYGETWLNRELTQRLQHDFGLLYDYIVDHAVVWEKKNARRYSEDDELESEAEDMTPWKNNAYEFKMAKRGSLTFTADIPNLPIVDMLIKFDFKHACAHIPHPFPLTPESSKPITPPRKGFFSKSHKTAMDPVTVARQTELAYSRATNVQALGHSKHENALIKHFINLEYGDKIGEVDPYDARLGRWILLYGILQVLSQICSDTPGIRHKKGVSYFLNPPMRGLPSWEKDPDNNDIESSSQENTHCWRAAKRWEEERQEQMSSMRRHHEITIPGYDNGMGARNYSSSHLPSSSSLLSTPTLISSRRVSPSPAPEDIVGGVVPNITDSPSFARQGSMIPPVPTAMPETPRRNMPHRMVSPSTPRNGTPTRGHAPMSVQGSTFKPPPEWA